MSTAEDGPSTPSPPKPAKTKLQETQEQVDEVVGIMRENVDNILERGAKLSELDDRAAALEQGAAQFEQQASKLKRKYWFKNKKMTIILSVVGIVAGIVILFFIFV